jgi:hypothetical protein
VKRREKFVKGRDMMMEEIREIKRKREEQY